MQIKFRYITTASIGVEQGWVRPEAGIETWTVLQRGHYEDVTRSEAISFHISVLYHGKDREPEERAGQVQ